MSVFTQTETTNPETGVPSWLGRLKFRTKIETRFLESVTDISQGRVSLASGVSIWVVHLPLPNSCKQKVVLSLCKDQKHTKVCRDVRNL